MNGSLKILVVLVVLAAGTFLFLSITDKSDDYNGQWVINEEDTFEIVEILNDEYSMPKLFHQLKEEGKVGSGPVYDFIPASEEKIVCLLETKYELCGERIKLPKGTIIDVYDCDYSIGYFDTGHLDTRHAYCYGKIPSLNNKEYFAHLDNLNIIYCFENKEEKCIFDNGQLTRLG